MDSGDRPVAGGEELTPQDLALEALLLGFRTAEGIDLVRFRESYGIDLAAANERLIDRLASSGLLRVEGDRLRPTLEGWAVADSLARDFEV